MSVRPLTEDELEKLPYSHGSTYPRNSFLRCQCGEVGTARSISSHRSHAGQAGKHMLCDKEPDVFMDLEAAQQYEAGLSADQRQARSAEEGRLRQAWLGEHPEALPQPKRPRGRPRKYPLVVEGSDGEDGTDDPGSDLPAATPRAARGEGRGGGSERVEVPKQATVRITLEVPADAYNRFNQARLNPEYGFSGDMGDYYYAIEVSYWVIDAWLKAGMPCPLLEWPNHQAAA